jgi:hypothetical protein
MLTGIKDRLMLLTYLYGEDDYEETETRLRVENASSGEVFEVYRIYYLESGNRFIRVARWSEPALAGEVRELVESLEDRMEPEAEMIRRLLAEALEIIGLELKQSDANGMGWPVAIAAAAYLADNGNGVVCADGEGWMEPTAKEVSVLLNE